jgi:hypothetical protein
MTWTTTLSAIRKHGPYTGSWTKLLASPGETKADDTEVSIEYILDLLGLDDALWALRAVDGHEREMRLLAVSYARDVQHLMTDERGIAALDVAERYAHGEATDKELGDALAAGAAAWDVAWDVSWAAAQATQAAAWAAARAAWEAAWAAAEAARNAAGAAAWDAQSDRLRAMVRGEWPHVIKEGV